MSELPCDLVEEILCRVPATSLERLRLTCKEWNGLFNEMRFSRKHFSKAAKQFMVLTLTNFKVSLLSVNLHNEIPSVEVTSEVSLIDHSNSNQVDIRRVSHCDGLLLCTLKQDTRIVVWNPCTGQTKWIETGKNRRFHDFALGYCQENQSCNKSYKILSYKGYHNIDQEFEIYDINSNSWRNLDVTLISDYHFAYSYYYNVNVSLKGKAYCFAFDKKEEQLCLISFDYTRERFERVHLPYECYRFEDAYLSVVKEEKLSVLLRRKSTSRKEIWVTNKIDDKTKEISWSKLIDVEVLDTGPYTWRGNSLLVDEEKKIYLSNYIFMDNSVITVSIVGEDNDATQVDSRVLPSYWSDFVDYVPSLTQIQQPVRKRKRGQ